MNNNQKIFSIILIVLVVILIPSCERVYPPSDYEEHDLLVVYENKGNDFYLIDPYLFTINKEVNLDISEDFFPTSMCVSTNNDYLLFTGRYEDDPKRNYYIVKYDISADSAAGIFSLGLKELGYPKICAAHLDDEPGLIYLYSNNGGTYKIDFLKEKCSVISFAQNLPKDFYYPPETDWMVRNNYYPNTIYSFSYTELEFFSIESHLRNCEFILNKHDIDSVVIKDMKYSSKDEKLYVSYLLSQKKAIRGSAFFGAYDMLTLEFDTSHVVLPWSTNPYYLAYNSGRDECYMIGETNQFYIIGLDSTEYYLKDVIELTDKTTGPSRIAVRSDCNIAFVSCIRDNRVYVVDLETKQVYTTISIETPYQLVLI
jgi:hypothetical protein